MELWTGLTKSTGWWPRLPWLKMVAAYNQPKESDWARQLAKSTFPRTLLNRKLPMVVPTDDLEAPIGRSLRTSTCGDEMSFKYGLLGMEMPLMLRPCYKTL